MYVAGLQMWTKVTRRLISAEERADKRDEELQELWDRCGDHEAMFWEPGMHRPALIADFETEEAE